MSETQLNNFPSAPAQEELKVGQDQNTSQIEPNSHYLDEIKGFTNRIEAVISEHFGSDLPVIHFTNAEVGNEIGKLVSTGFLERFSEEGSVKKIHVGAFKRQDEIRGPFRDMTLEKDSLLTVLGKLRRITGQFYQHGLRTNKNQLRSGRGASYSLPAAIIMEKPDKLDRGTDNYDHWIVRDSQGKKKILAIVKFEPHRAVNWITLKKNEENEILKRMVHGLGINRLEQIANAYNEAPDPQKKADLALYAHDLVDAYLVDRDEFDSLFVSLDDSVRKTIDERRRKFNFFGINQEQTA